MSWVGLDTIGLCWFIVKLGIIALLLITIAFDAGILGEAGPFSMLVLVVGYDF